MPALRMTPTRIDLLRAVKAGNVRVDVLSWDRMAYRVDKLGYPVVTHAFHLMLHEKLVSYPDRKTGEPRSVTAEITRAGDYVLDAYEGPEL
jgi:hypothetical protein